MSILLSSNASGGSCSVAIQQLLREWPPGYGGVERVAHELSLCWGGVTYSLDVQVRHVHVRMRFPVSYRRKRLRSVGVGGRLHVPLPSRSLISLVASSEPLHGHLPSPGVLLVLVLARLLRPRRIVTAHWHCFLEKTPGLSGHLFGLYQWIALRVLPHLSAVVTTSPVMSVELQRCGCSLDKVVVLPCCLSASQEQAAMAIPLPVVRKRVSHCTFFSLVALTATNVLTGCSRHWRPCAHPGGCRWWGMDLTAGRFEDLAHKLFFGQHRVGPKLVQFHGRLSELEKQAQIAASDVLVLPSDRSNEAFGIVQLEAMAAGRIALAFDQPRSGDGLGRAAVRIVLVSVACRVGGSAAAVGGSAPDAKPHESAGSGPL